MGYCIDLSNIDIDHYRNVLKKRYLIPSQIILKENIDERFRFFKNKGILSAAALLELLKKKEKIEGLAKDNLFSVEYLKVLLRHLKGMLAKPRKLEDFTWIAKDVIDKLKSSGIKNTKQLYEAVIDRKNINDLAEALSVSKEEMLQLVKQTDLTRIQWVNATFAHVLFEAGYDTIEKVKSADSEILYKGIIEANKEKDLYKGNIGLNDIKLLIELAGDITLEIKY